MRPEPKLNPNELAARTAGGRDDYPPTLNTPREGAVAMISRPTMRTGFADLATPINGNLCRQRLQA